MCAHHRTRAHTHTLMHVHAHGRRNAPRRYLHTSVEQQAREQQTLKVRDFINSRCFAEAIKNN